MTTMNELSSLDDLLSESLAIRDEAQATKAMREKLKRGGMPAAERAEIEAKVREWEARKEWLPVATVAVFEHMSCDCGYFSETFSHVMHKQTHRQKSNLTRYVQATTVLPDLPQLVAKQHHEVSICAECATEKGWNLEQAIDIEWEA